MERVEGQQARGQQTCKHFEPANNAVLPLYTSKFTEVTTPIGNVDRHCNLARDCLVGDYDTACRNHSLRSSH